MEDRREKLHRADAVRRRLAGGKRPRGIDHRRLARTLSLGTLAVAAAIYWLAVEYDVDMGELSGYLGASFLFVVLFAALAIGGAVVLRVARKLQNRTRNRADQ